MIHHAFSTTSYNGLPLHLTHITMHDGYEDGLDVPVMTLFFQSNNAITADFQDALEDLDDFQELAQFHPDHDRCHVAGPMPTRDPYLPHIHFTSSIFGSPMRYKVFNLLVTFGHLRQDEVMPMMSTFFDMVQILPKRSTGNKKSKSMSKLKFRLTPDDKAAILRFAKH